MKDPGKIFFLSLLTINFAEVLFKNILITITDADDYIKFSKRIMTKQNKSFESLRALRRFRTCGSGSNSSFSRDFNGCHVRDGADLQLNVLRDEPEVCGAIVKGIKNAELKRVRFENDLFS